MGAYKRYKSLMLMKRCQEMQHNLRSAGIGKVNDCVYEIGKGVRFQRSLHCNGIGIGQVRFIVHGIRRDLYPRTQNSGP